MTSKNKPVAKPKNTKQKKSATKKSSSKPGLPPDGAARGQVEELLTRYKLLSEISPDIMLFIRKDDLRILDGNEAALRAYGYSREELLTKTISDLRHPDTLKDLPGQLDTAYAGGVIFETRHCHRDGTSFPVEVSSRGMTVGKDQIILSIIRDITERKRAEESLRQSELKFSIIFDKSPFAASLSRLSDGVFVDINETFEKVFGYTRQEVIGKTSLDLGINPDTEGRARILAGLKKPGFVSKLELTLRKKSGEMRLFSVNIDVVEVDDEHYILNMAEDITESKEMEKALRVAEERFRTLIEHSQDAITLLAADGTVLYDSPSIVRILGYTPTERIGRKIFEFVPREERAGMEDGFAEFTRRIGAITPSKLRFLHKDGTARQIEGIRTNLLRNPAVQAVVVNYRDITERLQAEEARHSAEANYRALIEQIPAVTYMDIADGSAQSTFVSPQIKSILGVSQQEWIQGDMDFWRNLIHPDDQERVLTAYQHAVNTGQPFNEQYRMFARDGRTVWIDDNAVLLETPSGQTNFLQGVMFDVTDSKLADESLRRSQQETAHANSLLLALSQAAQAVQRVRTEAEIFETIQGQMTRLGYNATVFELDHEGKGLRLAYINYGSSLVHRAEKIAGISMRTYRLRPRQGTVYQCVLDQRETMHVEDAAQPVADALPKKLHLLARPIANLMHLQQSTFCPLIVGEETIGIFAITGPDLTEADNPAITAFARQATIAIQNARLYEQAQQEIAGRKRAEEELQLSEKTARQAAEQLQIVNQINLTISAGLDFETLMKTIYEQCRQIGYSDSFYIALHDLATGVLNFPFYYSDGKPNPHQPLNLREKPGIASHVIESRKTIYIPDIRSLPAGITPVTISPTPSPTQSYLGVPLILSDRVIGLLSMQSVKLNAYTPEQIQTIELLATQVAIAIQNSQLFGRIQQELMELEKAQEALKQSEEKFRLAFMTSMDAYYWSTLEEGRILEINPVFEDVFGYPRDELIGKTSMELGLYYDPTDRAKMISELKAKGFVKDLELKGVKKDGKRITISLSVSKMMLNNQMYIIGIIRDITERKIAEEALKNYNARLEAEVSARTQELRQAQEQVVRQERLAVLGQLAGSVGHELRNPLGVINTSIYYLKLVQPDADWKIKEHHAIIEKEVQNATKIIGDLLDYARVISSDRQTASVPGLVRQTLDRFPVPAGVKLTLNMPDDLPDVFADPLQVQQVLGNLTVNACQAMAASVGKLSPQTGSVTAMAGGGELTISAHEVVPVPGRGREKKMVAIFVKDTGTGITPENMKRLFEPLFSTRITGIGLGLAVSRKLVEANDGRIEVESEVGKGSTFKLFLPAADRQ